MYDSIMLDLETMGKSSNAAIVSIGMFKFSMDEVQNYDQIHPEQKFIRNISLRSCQQYGLEIDATTIYWWMEQPDSVRSAVGPGNSDLKAALMDVTMFMDSGDNPQFYIWGNGAAFDNAILANAFEAVGYKYPVSYKRDMCYRTLKNICLGVAGKAPLNYGVKHNALDDAIAQGLALQRMIQESKVHGLVRQSIGR